MYINKMNTEFKIVECSKQKWDLLTAIFMDTYIYVYRYLHM